MTRTSCLDALAAAITGFQLGHPIRVAIDGVDGSGKTVIADELVDFIRRAGREVIRASIDGFRELLEPMGPLGSRRFRTAVFDYRSDRTVEPPVRVASSDAVLLFDGVFLLRPELEGLWDVTVWVDAPFEITVERAVARDAGRGAETAAAIRDKYQGRYVPGQRLYLQQCQPKERADIVFRNAEFERPTVSFRRVVAV